MFAYVLSKNLLEKGVFSDLYENISDPTREEDILKIFYLCVGGKLLTS